MEDFRTNMTRLEAHRKHLELTKYLGPLLRIDDLSSEEIALINMSFFQRVKDTNAQDIKEIYAAYASTLHEWGVICPHPQPYRLYDGWQHSHTPLSFNDSCWYSCQVCSTAVINR